MARKWFQLVGEDGNAVTSTDAVVVDIEDVVALRDAVKEKLRDSHLAGIAASDLTVFANRAEYDAKRSVLLPQSGSPVTAYGNNEDNALIVQVPKRAESDSRYFIQPNVQEQVEKAVFVIVEEDEERNGVGMDSGAALLIKDGFLVGIHLETINALREEMDRKKTVKDRLNDVEESLDNIARSGLAQGCSGLLAHEFKDVVSEYWTQAEHNASRNNELVI
ncbi:uncharacterized protein PITG_04781 [Phytophthora infestans T30-4]|uniref:Uncharacterized protein n=1 Tax=Phytophthora infestans (strain T30-4) TaxID=403677 RepID=D0N213_PHYIT|nr:uncharacterized protein PITG_04781 [Phytophthora infestans T30-4]EEY68342.1 conserved hypothetical protein [Phytophthora infestans T30-4]|eukprot:XP_002905501.1 conserved hypothetical protein [Phytophthora infestans T30-4]